MGGRGSFMDVNTKNFMFKEGGQTFVTRQIIDGVKIIEKIDGRAVAAPQFSHTADSIYAIIQNGELKHIAFYDENHNQVRSIDLLHKHQKMIPHVHINLNHDGPAYPLTQKEIDLINRIRKEGNLK